MSTHHHGRDKIITVYPSQDGNTSLGIVLSCTKDSGHVVVVETLATTRCPGVVGLCLVGIRSGNNYTAVQGGHAEVHDVVAHLSHLLKHGTVFELTFTNVRNVLSLANAAKRHFL